MGRPRWYKIAGANKVNIDLDLLRIEYLNKRPVRDIADDYGVTIQTIYARLKTLGITRTNSESHIGQKAHNNKGGSIDSSGYRVIHVNGKQVREHRVVAEKMLGRKLLPKEVVHHKNGNRSDNRPENLEVHASHSDHMKEHMKSDEARRRGAKGLAKILENRRKKSPLKAVGFETLTGSPMKEVDGNEQN